MFNNFTDDQVSYENCNIVQPAGHGNGALLIGDFNSATDLQKIKQYNIRTIITAAVNMEHLAVPNNVVHITYPLLDANTENIKRFFDESTIMIKNSLKNGSVLVHCAAGISRSATLVIAYIMKTRRIGFKQAISIVRANRNVRPNLGFQRQLKQYEKQIIDGQQNRAHQKKTINDKNLIQQKLSLWQNSKRFLKILAKDSLISTKKKELASKKNSISTFTKQTKRSPIPKQAFYVLGQAHGVKELNLHDSIGYSQQIKPPIIQNHHKNALNSGWVKFQIKKHI